MKQFGFIWYGIAHFHSLALELFQFSCSLLCNAVHRDRDSIDISQNTLVYYIGDTMLIGSDKQVIASISDDLGKHMKIREWEINPTTIQELTTSLKFLSPVILGVFG